MTLNCVWLCNSKQRTANTFHVKVAGHSMFPNLSHISKNVIQYVLSGQWTYRISSPTDGQGFFIFLRRQPDIGAKFGERKNSLLYCSTCNVHGPPRWHGLTTLLPSLCWANPNDATSHTMHTRLVSHTQPLKFLKSHQNTLSSWKYLNVGRPVVPHYIYIYKGKDPVTGPVWPRGWVRGIALLFHDRGTRRGEWSAAPPGRTLPPGKIRYPF